MCSANRWGHVVECPRDHLRRWNHICGRCNFRYRCRRGKLNRLSFKSRTHALVPLIPSGVAARVATIARKSSQVHSTSNPGAHCHPETYPRITIRKLTRAFLWTYPTLPWPACNRAIRIRASSTASIPTRYRRVNCPVVGDIYAWLLSVASNYPIAMAAVQAAGPGSIVKIETQLKSGQCVAMQRDPNYTPPPPQERYGTWAVPQGAGQFE